MASVQAQNRNSMFRLFFLSSLFLLSFLLTCFYVLFSFFFSVYKDRYRIHPHIEAVKIELEKCSICTHKIEELSDTSDMSVIMSSFLCEPSKLTKLPCNHVFHTKCFSHWFEKNPKWFVPSIIFFILSCLFVLIILASFYCSFVTCIYVSCSPICHINLVQNKWGIQRGEIPVQLPVPFYRGTKAYRVCEYDENENVQKHLKTSEQCEEEQYQEHFQQFQHQEHFQQYEFQQHQHCHTQNNIANQDHIGTFLQEDDEIPDLYFVYSDVQIG